MICLDMSLKHRMKFFEYEIEKYDKEKDNKYEYIKNVFDIFCKKVIFDSTQNLLKKCLFFDIDESYENIRKGYGLNCQEQFYLLKHILSELGIDSRIVHGDIYDYDLCIIKPLLTSALLVELGEGFIHMNPISNIIEYIPYGEQKKRTNYKITDISKNFYIIEKRDDNQVYSTEKIYKKSSEMARINKLKEKFKGSAIVPFGITNPFYWLANPERRIFYNILMDTIRIQIGRESEDFDLLEWKNANQSNWLSASQKELISVCVNEINKNIDDYLEISDVAFITIDEDEKNIYDKYTFIDESGEWKYE